MRLVIFLLISLCFTQPSIAGDSTFNSSCGVDIVSDNVAANLGFKLGDGIHLKGICETQHNFGVYVSGFAASDGYVGGDFNGGEDGFRWELTGRVGYRGATESGSLTYDFSYAEIHVGVTTGKIVIPAAAGSLNWNRETLSPYVVVEAYLEKDVGPGREVAHRIGASRGQFAGEFGGHSGVFENESALVSFVRLKYNSKPQEWLSGGTFNLQGQLGLEEPADDRLFAGLSWKSK